MADKTALDALNKAIGAPPADETEQVETPETEETEQEEVETTETEGTETEETEEGSEGEEGTEGEESEETEEGDEPAEGEETDEDGEKPAKKTEPRAEPNDLDDPIPEGIAERTKGRITRLVDQVKDLAPRAAVGDELLQHVRQAGLDGDQFGALLTYGRLKNSDNIEDNRKAYNLLMVGLKQLAPKIGEVLPWANPLEGHPDLQARVDAKTLDVKDAAELATARNRVTAENTAAQRAGERRNQDQERGRVNAQLEQQCVEDMNELGAQLQSVDRDFERKLKAMTPAVRAQIKATPPQLRVNAFLKAFRAIKVAPRPVMTQKKPGNQPMRVKTPAAGGKMKAEPKSALDALNMRLGLAD
jgi:hypothetical protein